jgi:hypothetical protein
MFQEVEVTFGSERILSREHAALEQASSVARGYTFVDAVADQKAFLERLAVELGKSARGLLPRVADGTVRFRLLRKMPSHEWHAIGVHVSDLFSAYRRNPLPTRSAGRGPGRTSSQ